MSALTRLAHVIIAEQLKPGDVVVDLTAGNGHDTLFLARCVAPRGRVYAFDIQPRAVEAVRARLCEHRLDSIARLHRASHENWLDFIDVEDRMRLRVVMMNLGYLPGGDESIVTQSASTLAAVESAMAALRPDGRLSILAYTGHPGGREEAETVLSCLNKLSDEERIRLELHPPIPAAGGPILMMAIKKPEFTTRWRELGHD